MKKNTIKEFIQYMYIRNLSRIFLADRPELERLVFIQQRLKTIKVDESQWSRHLRQDQSDFSKEKTCLFCGRDDHLKWDFLAPMVTFVSRDSRGCGGEPGLDNHAWVCWECKIDRGEQGIFAYLKYLYPEDKKYFDRISPAVCNEYLRALYYGHLYNGTLEQGSSLRESRMTALDLERIFYLQGKKDSQAYQY